MAASNLAKNGRTASGRRAGGRARGWLGALALVLTALAWQGPASCQLPDDMQRELNQSLAEQARIEAMRARQQQQAAAANRAGQQPAPAAAQRQPFDPNNYSFQQVSPPIQYSYYQPYGDAASQQPAAGGQQASQPPPPNINIDLNNLNLDLGAPRPAAGQQPALVPSFTGAGGLPVMQPPAAASNQQLPVGQSPLAPQAQQRGPPLTEADFRDITGGENYGAPGGSDFGLSGASPKRRDGADSQLAEFGLAADRPGPGPAAASRRQDLSEFGLGDMGSSGSSGQQPAGNPFGFDFFADSGQQQQRRRQQPAADFDFAGSGNERASAPGSSAGGGAPGSLQALLGGTFPGLGGGRDSGTMGLERLAQGGGGGGQAGNQARADDLALDMADLGRADGFPGAGDMGPADSTGAGQDDDGQQQQQQPGAEFGLAAAAAAPQPKSVPYPDTGPQFVGTLWALGQPQSLSQTRYNALPDKGTYQDYPAYQAGGNDFSAVRRVVERTPAARPAGDGRYARPAAADLAAEWRSAAPFDYSKAPLSANEVDND